MDTATQAPVDDELHLLTEWGDAATRSRTEKAAIYSVLAHIAVILTLVLLPSSVYQARPREVTPAVHHIITPLIEPLTELTQKDPNKGKVKKVFDAAEIQPRPSIRPSAPPPTTTRPAAARRAVIPAMPSPKPAAPAPLPEPPKVDSSLKEPPKSDLPQLPAPAVPQIQAAEKPKIAFENVSGPPPPVAPGRSAIPIPGNAVDAALRQAGHPGSAGGLTVGDQGYAGPGSGSPLGMTPTPGAPASQLQLLSDPLGVDFKPYLIRVLASVKQHWMAVIPESVRYGRRGSVAIQFSISRDGLVPKLVIASASGTDALDRAAVAGISASVPFPPLPPDFKGDKIVLQFNFAYNMPKQ